MLIFERKVWLLVLLFIYGSIAQAVPNLQLYSPQGTYNPDTETWVIPGYEYELWVIGAFEIWI